MAGTEHRRLQHLRTVMGVSSADDGSPESKQSAEKFLEKAQRKLEVGCTMRFCGTSMCAVLLL